MKKLSLLVALVITCSLVFGFSVNPSMDGRAVVADNGIFPPGGYYGRAPGYLPGDTVIVTNHNNGFSIDVLILGSYDAYEGIAILLSPDAAEKLQIVKGKDTYVKVQKKQPIPYEEAVATSKNKKITEKQAIDTDKNSSVLPGVTDELLNDVVSSNKNVVVPEDDIQLPYVDVEVLDNNSNEQTENLVEENDVTQNIENQTNETESVENVDTTGIATEENLDKELPVEEAELAEIENEEISDDDYIITENIQEEIPEVVENNSNEEVLENNYEELAQSNEETVDEISSVENEVSDVPSEVEDAILAEPEEYVESESIDSPVFAEVVEPEETIVEEPIISTEDEVVLDDVSNEDFDENDVIDSPLENEVVQVEPEEIIEPELPIDESEEVVLDDIQEDDLEDSSDIILTDDVAEADIDEKENNLFGKEIVDGYEVEYFYPEEVGTDSEEVATNEETLTEEPEEVFIPEEDDVALEENSEEEVTLEDVALSEEELAESELIDTDVLEEEPELVVLDEQMENEKSENTMPETPKDIFSMIVGENPDEEILHDVILEEADPRLPELDDSLASEENVEADMEITLDQPEVESVMDIAQVAVSEKEEPKKLSSLMEKEYLEAGDFDNTVSNFNDLPKVKQTKSKTYYIQIATVNKKENVAKMIDLHGKKYPVYVIKNPAKSSYQVLVGPLNDDEYALVLARFKQTYKDAFLRVLK